MGKAENQARRDERLDRSWKDTLAAIRSGLPLQPGVDLYRDAVDQTDRKSRDREVLIALCDRQQWKCFWCGLLMTATDPNDRFYRTLDHVVARSTRLQVVGHLTNLRAVCRGCNELRGEIQHVAFLVKDRDRLKEMVTRAQETLRRERIRQRVTMSGRRAAGIIPARRIL